MTKASPCALGCTSWRFPNDDGPCSCGALQVTNLDKLRKLAEEAADGPWEFHGCAAVPELLDALAAAEAARDEALADGVLSQRVCDIENDRAHLLARLNAAEAELERLRSVERDRNYALQCHNERLEVVSNARDEACDIAEKYIDEGIGDPNGQLARIAALRAIGAIK